MKLNINRRTTAVILLIAAVFLLAVNLLINHLNQKEHPEKVQSDLSSSQVDSLFMYSLNSFGLSKEWIKEVQNKKN